MENVTHDNRCTLYISSCDAYSDLWKPFFTLFVKYWPDCPYPIVLSSETKTFSYPGLDIQCPRFYRKGARPHWSERTAKTLKSIKSPFILFTLDDYILTEPVDQNVIDHGLNFMESNPDASRLRWIRKHAVEQGEIPRYELEPNRLITAYPSIWRHETLMRTLRPHETVWNWESGGNDRCTLCNDNLYICTNYFIFIPRGGALFQGKWQQPGIDILRANGIELDFKRRGIRTKIWKR
ncbi:MAG: hypothetical protein LBB86_00120 [Oscillospiraceae bacterium]|jgi:hypothetical protein|nr:hypothetical protein [Oscillospiraceae bacterium]